MNPLGNPSPLGLLSFAFTTALLMYVELGWVENKFQILITGYAIFLGGLCQVIVGIFELIKGSSFSFTVFCSYGAFWLGWAIIYMERGRYTSNFGDFTFDRGMSAFFAQWGVVTFLYWIMTFRKNVCLVVVFALLTTTFILLSVAESTGNHSVKLSAGYFGFFTAIGAFYTCVAEMINGEWGRHVLPGLRPLHSPERYRITVENVMKRISYDSKTNTMLISFRGFQIANLDAVDAVKRGVTAAVESTGAEDNKVHVIVDYHDVLISEAVKEEYWRMVAELQHNYYLSVKRFDITTFGTAFSGNQSVAVGMTTPTLLSPKLKPKYKSEADAKV